MLARLFVFVGLIGYIVDHKFLMFFRLADPAISYKTHVPVGFFGLAYRTSSVCSSASRPTCSLGSLGLSATPASFAVIQYDKPELELFLKSVAVPLSQNDFQR
mmetsp:Transcript_126926/g.317184  ORF Transcript_126926/g.317184 Transcript_126926/m.317184 type:complete len:103 (-) Transcript_126926:292-600(-)